MAVSVGWGIVLVLRCYSEWLSVLDIEVALCMFCVLEYIHSLV